MKNLTYNGPAGDRYSIRVPSKKADEPDVKHVFPSGVAVEVAEDVAERVTAALKREGADESLVTIVDAQARPAGRGQNDGD